MDLSLLTEFDGPAEQRHIGIIAPFDLAIERELWRWAPAEVSLHLARTHYEPVPVSRLMAELVSNTSHLEAATRDVLHVEPEVVAYLCSSGSFVNGVEYEKTLVAAIEAAGAKAAVTTSGALAEAVQALRISRICVITPYDEELTQLLHVFLGQLGVAVLRSDHLGLGGGIWKVNYRTVAERIVAADNPGAQAIFVSCTNLPTYDIIAPLEKMLGKPIMTANQRNRPARYTRAARPGKSGQAGRRGSSAAAAPAGRGDVCLHVGRFRVRAGRGGRPGRRVGESRGGAASSTSLAFVHALAALGCSRVAVAASYPRDIAELFVNFLAAHGISVESMGNAGIGTAAEVGRLGPADVRALALANDNPDAEALLIPDTAMHTVAQVDALEELLGKPVLAANVVTVWEGLRLAGISRRVAGMAASTSGYSRRSRDSTNLSSASHSRTASA
jgi:maleate isomerase